MINKEYISHEGVYRVKMFRTIQNTINQTLLSSNLIILDT
jgi:hypothetical protein